jgi:transcriptional regulator with GAF, ATPase, and Fis domain
VRKTFGGTHRSPLSGFFQNTGESIEWRLVFRSSQSNTTGAIVMNANAFPLVEVDQQDSQFMSDSPNSINLNLSGESVCEETKFKGIVGQSITLRRVLQLVESVAEGSATVLLLGETGTGKELVARAIHNLSCRKSRTFVKFNCAAIPGGLLESELFGHERGAFTGAIAQKVGRLELADHGSLFLDEIGDIPLELQPKLLRLLQEREFERLGSTRTRKVDVRVVAATHR